MKRSSSEQTNRDGSKRTREEVNSERNVADEDAPPSNRYLLPVQAAASLTDDSTSGRQRVQQFMTSSGSPGQRATLLDMQFGRGNDGILHALQRQQGPTVTAAPLLVQGNAYTPYLPMHKDPTLALLTYYAQQRQAALGRPTIPPFLAASLPGNHILSSIRIQQALAARERELMVMRSGPFWAPPIPYNPDYALNRQGAAALAQPADLDQLTALSQTQRSLPMAANVAAATLPLQARGDAVLAGSRPCRCLCLAVPADRYNLSEYQCLVREQIELFEASEEDAGETTQGRNRTIQPHQIGVRCKWCVASGDHRRGAKYFPSKLTGIYQASQNMVLNHFSKSCRKIPPEIRSNILALKDSSSSSAGAGRKYWSRMAESLGVFEAEIGLRLK